MRRERSKKETEGDGGGRMERGRAVMGKGTNLHFISGVNDLLPVHRVAPVGVENTRPRCPAVSTAERECGQAERQRVREGGRRQGGSRGMRGGGKTSKYFL